MNFILIFFDYLKLKPKKEKRNLISLNNVKKVKNIVSEKNETNRYTVIHISILS